MDAKDYKNTSTKLDADVYDIMIKCKELVNSENCMLSENNVDKIYTALNEIAKKLNEKSKKL